MQRLLSRHAQEYNRRWQRVGHLFGDRFFSRVIDDDAYLSEVCRYVLDNPVSAGIARSAAEWPWSGGTAFEDVSGV